MKIEQLTVGMLQEHTYFAIDEATKHAFIIDPGAEATKILEKIKKDGLIIEKILLTHGHFDHIGAVQALKEALNVPVVIHEKGKLYLNNPDWNLSSMFGGDFVLEADEYLKEGDVITLEANPEASFSLIFVPGHTADGSAFYNEKEKVVIVGDILFYGSVGRTDNPGGDMDSLLRNIQEKLFVLPEDTMVYPGHGGITSIKQEKLTNPFFNLFD